MKINLLSLLYQQGLSQNEVCKQLNCTYANFNKLCNGKTNSIKFETLEKLCKILNCGVQDILVIEEKTGDGDYSI